MDRAPGVLIDKPRVLRPVSPPRLRLLIEWESRRRVFFENLKDLLFSRELPPLHLTSRPARFWNDVFVPTGRPWTSFMESMLWHVLLLVVFVWGQSRVWTPVKTFQDRDSYHRSIIYYPPTESYRASESRAANIKPHSRVKHESAQQAARQTPLPVTPEQKPSIVTPPDIKEAAARMPDLPTSHPVAPMAPFANAGGPRRNALSGPSVAPPTPQIDQAKLDPSATHRLALPQPPAISPAPNLGMATARSMNMPTPAGQHVVPPPPSIQSQGNAGKSGRLNSLSGHGPDVVPPSPSVQVTGNSAYARLGSTPGSDSQVVAPPPSLRGAAASSETGRYSSLSAGGPNIVPPSPSLQGTGNSRTARLGTLADGTSQVITPAPSVQGAADSVRTGRSNSLIGGAASVVPPSPSVSGFGDGARDAHAGTRSGIGSQVVPPPASVQGSQGAASMVRSLSGAGSEVVPPPPSVEGGGNSGAGTHVASLSGDGSAIAPPQQTAQAALRSGITGPLQPMEPLPEVAAQPARPAPIEDKATVEELPLGFLGLVLAAPGTSYFSNFEVFVAKRRVAKGQLQLIKLVYQFLPYQKRLSEYDLNNLPPRVIKLRVIPDPSCNEALGEIIQPSPDPARPVTEYPKLPAVLSSADVNQVLPCYRTNADDFQKAMLGRR